VTSFSENSRISPSFAEAILGLFESNAIRRAYQRRSEFWLLDGCPFYIGNLHRFVDPSYVPTDEDQVMARVRTTGIVVTPLEQKLIDAQPGEPDTIKFQVVDVGGQRSERKKWINCFDDVKAILFVVNLNAYDQVLFEDANKNRMLESLELFGEIVSNPMFVETTIVLFLNKKDLFADQIKERDLTDVRDTEGKQVFADYKGQRNHMLESMEYIKSRFRALVPLNKHVDIQDITSIVRRDVRGAFEEVKRTLIEINRKKMEVEKKLIKKEAQNLGRKPACPCCGGEGGSGSGSGGSGGGGSGGGGSGGCCRRCC